MHILQSKHKTRREFIKTCLRFGVGGGLVASGIALGLRKKTESNGNDLCQLSSPCQGCSKYSGCRLPKALDAKNHSVPEGDTRGRKKIR